MPHVDEWLGTVTVAAAGLTVAIAMQPQPPSPAQLAAAATTRESVAAAYRVADPIPMVPIEVIARRGDALPPDSRRAGTPSTKPAA